MEFQVQRGSMRRVAPKPLASNVGMIIAPRRASLRRPNVRANETSLSGKLWERL